MKLKNKSGFTLLEIIIVIIIIGVLASLALPRLFSTVEFSRSAEALASIATIRSSLERCYLQNNGTYIGCEDIDTELDIENPESSPNAHFTYAINDPASNAGYTITATRNTHENGDINSNIVLTQTATSVIKAGAGAFKSIK